MNENDERFSNEPQEQLEDAKSINPETAADEVASGQDIASDRTASADEGVMAADDEADAYIDDPVRVGEVADYDNPIGLTEAFAPIEFNQGADANDAWGRRWSASAKPVSDGWDQIVPDDDTPDDWREPDDGEFSQEDEDAKRRPRMRKEHHVYVEYDDVSDGDYDEAAASSSFNAGAAAALAAEKAAREAGADPYEAAKAAAAADAPRHGNGQLQVQPKNDSEDFPDLVDSLEPVDAGPMLVGGSSAQDKSEKVRGKASHGKHAAGVKEISVHERKSRRTRTTLIIVIVLLIVLAAALGYFAYHLFTTSQTVASQQAQANSSSSQSISDSAGKDVSTVTTKKTDVPDLASILGKTQDEAIAALGHGAQVRESRAVTDEGSTIKTSVTVPLTDEPADTKTGTPTVYLGLNEEGKIIQAGYSTSTSSLGYGAISFIDMVQVNHAVERTLQEANVNVADGAAVLPSDKMQYSTYASDGTTLTRERYSFSGDVAVSGKDCAWSAVLSYDYANANLTSNLSDTVRVIYIYVTTK